MKIINIKIIKINNKTKIHGCVFELYKTRKTKNIEHTCDKVGGVFFGFFFVYFFKVLFRV